MMDDRQEHNITNSASALYRKRRTLSRILAIQFVFQADLRNAWVMEAESLEYFKSLAQNPFEADEKATFSKEDFKSAWKYARVLIQGVLANRAQLDSLIIGVAQNWSLQRISSLDRAILRVATFEITHHPNNVTPAIAINEAVDIAKEYGLGGSSRFVNGILDKIRVVFQNGQTEAEQKEEDGKSEVPEPEPINGGDEK